MCRMFINFALDGRHKYVLAPCRLIMADETEIRKGERIPRRPLPKFDEIEGGLLAAVKRDGLLPLVLYYTSYADFFRKGSIPFSCLWQSWEKVRLMLRVLLPRKISVGQ